METDPIAPTALLRDLDDTALRHGFVQKVYGILGSQLLITTVVGYGVMRLADSVKTSNPVLVTGLLLASTVFLIGVMCLLVCYPQVMRRSPDNYIVLGLITLAESFLVGFVCSAYTKESVIIAVVLTAIVVLALSAFACQTTYDFTGYGPYLCCGVMVLCGISLIFFIASLAGLASSPAFQVLRLLYAAFGAFLFSCYIIYDTQKIIGGKHQQQFSIDDYAMASLTIYLDIIQLFLFLLQIFGNRK